MTTTYSDGHDGAPMSVERMRALLGAYGASPARWPQQERTAAEALLDRSTEARVLLAEATQLDALLDMVHPPSPSTALAERVRRRRFGWRGLRAVLWGETFGARAAGWMHSPKHQAVAVAGALALGVLLGAGLPDAGRDRLPVAHGSAATAVTAQHISVVEAPRGADPVGIDRPSPAGRTATEIDVGDPADDAPDPFGAAAHRSIDMVDGARLAAGPVPESGEPLGSIPLL